MRRSNRRILRNLTHPLLPLPFIGFIALRLFFPTIRNLQSAIRNFCELSRQRKSLRHRPIRMSVLEYDRPVVPNLAHPAYIPERRFRKVSNLKFFIHKN